MLIRPLITEKSLAEVAVSRYAFRVERGADKPAIKSEVERLFGVNVVEVHTVTRPGKRYRAGKRHLFGTRPKWKKAVVRLKEGQKIELFESPAK